MPLAFDERTLNSSAQYIASDIDITDPESDYLNLVVEVAAADGTGSLTLNADNGVTIFGDFINYNGDYCRAADWR